jgi:hypothetical protein
VLRLRSPTYCLALPLTRHVTSAQVGSSLHARCRGARGARHLLLGLALGGVAQRGGGAAEDGVGWRHAGRTQPLAHLP